MGSLQLLAASYSPDELNVIGMTMYVSVEVVLLHDSKPAYSRHPLPIMPLRPTPPSAKALMSNLKRLPYAHNVYTSHKLIPERL